MSTTMKAIQVAATGGVDTLVLATVAKPTAGAGQVLVRNTYSGVNFIDTYHRTGLYKLPLPFIPGREAVGTIEAVGTGVTRLAVGDRVAWIGPGSYAEYTAAPIGFTVKVPAAIPDETAAAALLQGLTALAFVKHAYPVQKGDYVLVHAGAGGTGGLLVQLAKQRGAHVIATTSSEAKADMARSLGADHVIRYDHEKVSERVLAITGGKGVAAVFDGVGKATFDESLASLGRRGFLISFGNASGKVPEVDLMRLSKNNVYLARPTLFEAIKTEEEFLELADELYGLIAQDKLKIRIHKTFPLVNAGDAHTEIEAGKTAGKILLQI
ncbi:putative NADPH--quinone reductase [Blastocladiella britannica]|nr:putative NADPH--quinone reductase [Blastocladiella britannica]